MCGMLLHKEQQFWRFTLWTHKTHSISHAGRPDTFSVAHKVYPISHTGRPDTFYVAHKVYPISHTGRPDTFSVAHKVYPISHTGRPDTFSVAHKVYPISHTDRPDTFSVAHKVYPISHTDRLATFSVAHKVYPISHTDRLATFSVAHKVYPISHTDRLATFFVVQQGKSEGFESCDWPIVRKRPIWVKIGDALYRVTLKFDGWPWKTIGHLSFAVSSFVQHFIAIGEFKLELQSGTPILGQIRWFLEPCDLEIWRMTLKNNRAPLLCYL